MAAAAAASPVHATEGVLRVKCAWQHDTDIKSMQTRDITGNAEFTYNPINDLNGSMTKEGLKATFVAATRDNVIEGIAHYVADGVAVEERVELNRRTAEIWNTIKTAKGGHLLRGTCVRLSGPDFGKETNGE